MSTRTATLAVLSAVVVAIVGVAIAGAVTSGGGATPTAANSPSLPPASTPSTPSATPSGPLGPVAPAPTPAATHTSPPAQTPSPHPTATPNQPTHSATPAPTKSSCPPAAGRVQAARRLLQHTSALPNVTLITSGPRQGLLGASDANARTLTLYVRSCSAEPTIQLAYVWGYEAGQFIPTQTWSSSTQAQWAHLRGIAGTPSQTLLKQDAASVYSFWQTGSSRYWQSPIAVPSYKQLSSLVPYLHAS